MNKTDRIKEIESIYGEDIADLVYMLQEKFDHSENDEYMHYVYDSRMLVIQFESDDVHISYTIYNKDITKVYVFDSEADYAYYEVALSTVIAQWEK